MIVIMDKTKRIAQSISEGEIDEYEANGTPMYNYTDDGKVLPWFDGTTWIYPKPISKTYTSKINEEQLEVMKSISDKLDRILNS